MISIISLNHRYRLDCRSDCRRPVVPASVNDLALVAHLAENRRPRLMPLELDLALYVPGVSVDHGQLTNYLSFLGSRLMSGPHVSIGHDTPVDLTKMQLARQRLSVLQEELRDIEETEAEMAEIMKHVDALQGILGSTKKRVS